MDFLKELFTQPLSFEEFEKAVSEKGIKLADLSKGEHVAKGKLTEALNANNTLKEDIKKLKGDLEALKNSNATAEEYKKKFEELQDKIEKDDKARKAEQEDKELTAAIEAVFGDKKFTSDYVRNGIIADMKTEIAKPENKGKGYTEIFDTLTKDKEGIFATENKMSMTGINPNANRETVEDSQIRAAMGLPITKKE